MIGTCRWLVLACLSCASLGGGSAPSLADGPPAPDLELVDRVPLWLPSFYRSMHELALGRRQSHVRVLWLGDSWRAADGWTQGVRRALQPHVPSGGPGLVTVGLSSRSHAAALVKHSGTWSRLPRKPASTRRSGDGVLGLAGVGAVPKGRRARARLSPRDGEPWAEGALRWEVLYRPTSSAASFEVKTSGGRGHRVVAGAGDRRASGLESVALMTRRSREIVLERFRGRLQLFGVVVESEQPGLVIDALGIEAARIATPLAWDAASWVEEVRRRDPSLVVLAYGNHDLAADPQATRLAYATLIDRVRLASPEADCLIVGPTDRSRKSTQPDVRVQLMDSVQRRAAAHLGCAFFSSQEAMGSPGSLAGWATQKPPLARRQRITSAGMQVLGQKLAERLLTSFHLLYPQYEP